MDRLQSLNPQTTQRLKDIFGKVYSLRSNDFSINENDDGTAEVAITCTKSMDSRVELIIEDDGFKAFMNFYPQINDGRPIGFDEAMEELNREGVKVNVNRENLQKGVADVNKGIIVERVPVAEGIRPINGRDAEVQIHFDLSDNKPVIGADGRVDYKNINNIIRVSKGDKLITKKPATNGVRGVTVKNLEVFPQPGIDIDIKVETGVLVNPAGTSYTAGIDGYVEFSKNVLGVFPVYAVNGDIDYSIGNIRFNGTVHVKGDVLSGFVIHADKDIIVEGIVQDAELKAKGDIVIKTGVKGNLSKIIRSQGDMLIGYCDKARLHAMGNIEVKKYAFNSEVFAGGRLVAVAGEGVVAGGYVKSFDEIIVKQLGTQGNSKFVTQCGTKWSVELELDKLNKEKEKLNATLEQIEDVLSKFDFKKKAVTNNPKIKKLLELKKKFINTRTDMEERAKAMLEEAKAKNPKIRIRGTVFEGVSIRIFQKMHLNKELLQTMVYYYDRKYHEIAWVSLKDENQIEIAQREQQKQQK